MKQHATNTELKRPFPHFKFPFEIEISVEKMDDEKCKWFSAPAGSSMLTTTNYGWFPTNVLMGVVKGIYSDTKKIGASIDGNLGTQSMTVIDTNTAIDLLTKAGYKIKSSN